MLPAVTLRIRLVDQILQTQQIFGKIWLERGKKKKWFKSLLPLEESPQIKLNSYLFLLACQNLKMHHLQSEAPYVGFCSSSD